MTNNAQRTPAPRAGSTYLIRLTSPAFTAGLFDNRRRSASARHVHALRTAPPLCVGLPATAADKRRLVMSHSIRAATFIRNSESASSCRVSRLRGCRPGPCTPPKLPASASAKGGRSPPVLIVEYVFSVIEPLEISTGGLSFTTEIRSAGADLFPFFRFVTSLRYSTSSLRSP